MENKKAVSYLYQHRKIIFMVGAILSFAAACYHLYHAFYQPDKTTTLRHCIFSGINFLLIVLFIKRPVFFISLLFLLTLQQLFSHGSAFAKRLYNHQFDWISLGVIILLPFFLYLLVLEKRILHNNKRTAA
jgi:hypothetical protein